MGVALYTKQLAKTKLSNSCTLSDQTSEFRYTDIPHNVTCLRTTANHGQQKLVMATVIKFN